MEARTSPSSIEGKSAVEADWPGLLKSIRTYAGQNIWLAITIVFLASLVEGMGLVMLLPIVGVLFAETMPENGVSAQLTEILAAFGPKDTFLQLLLFGTLFLVWMAVRGAILIYRDRQIVRLTNGYVDHLRVKMFGSFAYASWPAVRKLPKSELTNALTMDLKRVAVAIQFLSKVFITTTLSISYLIVGFLISPMVGLTLLVLTLVAAIVAVVWSRNSGVLGKSLTKGNKKSALITARFLDGLKTAKVYNAEKNFVDEYAATIDRLRMVQTKFITQQGRLRRSVEMLGAIAAVAILLIGFQLLKIAGAELVVIVVIVVRLTPSLLQSLTGFQSVAFAMPAFVSAQQRIQSIEKPSAILTKGEEEQVGSEDRLEPAEIVLDEVSVNIGHDGGETQLLYVENVCLPATGLIHLSGQSGAGKSTFAELIAGLYLPSSGKVRSGGLTLTSESLPAWQRRIAFAPQEPFLFNGTILENLTWPYRDFRQDGVWHALELAGADGLVRSLPGQLSLEIHDGGSRLSGGERQRLCLARALLRPSSVLIVDEGMSAVEPKMEAQILAKLKKLSEEKLIICASHSPVIESIADDTVRISPSGRIEPEAD